MTEAVVQQLYGRHAAYEHHGKKTGKARPDDFNEYPSVQNAEEDAYEVHAQRSERGEGRKLPHAEHDDESDGGVNVV